MKPRRLLSILLALCMVLVSVPITGVSFAASTTEPAGETTYVKKLPEYPILNAFTSDKFYDKIVANSDAQYKAFNAIGAFGTTYGTKQGKDAKYNYSGFASTVLNEVANADWNSLKANFSGYFTNNHHEHRAGKTALGPTIGIKSFMTVSIGGSNGAALYVTGGGKNLSNTTIRVGNKKFSSFLTTGDLYIKYENSSISWEDLYGNDKVDTCGGWVEKQVVTFADTERSHLRSVTFKDAAGNTCKEFKAGDKVTVEMLFTEPLRFADGENHSNVYIGLMYNNSVNEDYARLTKLDGRTLTFTFTVPSDGEVRTVSGIDFWAKGLATDKVALGASSAKYTLKHPYKNGILDFTSLDKSEGINVTSTMVTDLAGNSVTFSSDIDQTGVYSYTFAYFDDEKPYIALVDPIVITNNSDVKEALGKTDPSSADYTDKSDTHLGIGDHIRFKVYMNELSVSTNYAHSKSFYRYFNGTDELTFTTNLKNKNTGAYYTVTANYAGADGAPGTQYGLGSSGGRATGFPTSDLVITDDMVLEGDCINITGISFSSAAVANDFADGAGNPFDTTRAIPASTKQYKLDITAPTAETTNGATLKTADYGQGGFCFDFTLADDLSGLAGLTGTFKWADGSNVEYYYAVTNSTAAPTSWSTGTMGVPNSFTQLSGQNYLHIKPKEGIDYDVKAGSTLSFSLKDFAGNQGTQSFTLGNVTVDRIAPVLSYKSTAKTYVGATGNYETITFTASDTSGIDKAWFYWTASDTETVTADSGVWTEATTVNATDGTFSAQSETFDQNSSLTKNILWTKAADVNGNTSVKKLGAFEYALKSIAYTMDYSAALTTTLDITVSELTNGGALAVVIAADNSSLASMAVGSSKEVVVKYVNSTAVQSGPIKLNA